MKILFINHNTQNCGVADYGRRLYAILKTGMDIDYCDDGKPNCHWYDVCIYNYHYATMPDINLYSRCYNIALFHEAFINAKFDKVIPVESLPRPLFKWCSQESPVNKIPVIGSFGFGFPDKNFPGIAQLVKDQYHVAKLRLNIPFAEFGDKDGGLARHEVEKCKEILGGTKIRFEVNHDFLSDKELLNWLWQNDINLFLYKPSHGRGLSSCTDYALSVKKPIGVSASEMFRHLPPSICVDNISIPELIEQGIEPMQSVYLENNNLKLIEALRTPWL